MLHSNISSFLGLGFSRYGIDRLSSLQAQCSCITANIGLPSFNNISNARSPAECASKVRILFEKVV